MNKTELKSQVEELLAEIDKTHRYSMSRVYILANAVFNKNENPQSCASCLIRKVRELRKWLESQQVEKSINEPAPKKRVRKPREPKK